MSKLDALRVLLFAGEAFAVATLVMGIAWLGGASRHSASQRHLEWAAAFGALLLLPLLAAIAPSLVHFSVAAGPVAAPLPPQAVDLIPVANAPHENFFGFEILAKVAIGIWLSGAALVLARALFAAFALLRLKARSTPHRFGHLPIIGPRSSLRIADSDGGCGPVTWGLWRAVILLPREAVLWPRERLDAVLRHELAHVERHDCLTQSLALLACALYWPNPLVWFGARRLRREAEMAADDAVIASGIRPSTYASALLRIANDFRVRAHMPLAMAAPSALEARVQSVLAASQLRTGVTSRDAIRIAGIGFAAAAALAFARPSLAEEVTTAPLAPVASGSAVAAPSIPAAAPVPPVAPVAPREPKAPAQHRTVVEVTDDAAGMHVTRRPLTVEEQKHIREAVRQARSAVEAARPAVVRAIREAHVARAVMLRLKADEPKIKIAIAEAERVSSSEIHRALAEARAAVGREHLDQKTLAQMQQALDQVEANMTEDHGDVDIVVPDEPGGDGDANAQVKEK